MTSPKALNTPSYPLKLVLGMGWPMSALGHKQTCALQKAMSALPPKATLDAYFLMSARAQYRTLVSCTHACSTGHQYCENDRHEEECRHIRYQMAAFARVTESLYAHDRAMNHARPHGEPDKALVRVGVPRCD